MCQQMWRVKFKLTWQALAYLFKYEKREWELWSSSWNASNKKEFNQSGKRKYGRVCQFLNILSIFSKFIFGCSKNPIQFLKDLEFSTTFFGSFIFSILFPVESFYKSLSVSSEQTEDIRCRLWGLIFH